MADDLASPSPIMVSLVQAAAMLPVFLFALPGGALADIFDRRLTLISAQLWIAVAGLLLAVLAAMDLLGAWGLLALTFLIGAGTAVIFPAWAAAIPELVSRDDLVQAVALNGVGFNVARALGPALGGFAMALAGPAATFSLNAVGFLVLLGALLIWRRPAPARSKLPPERLPSAMRAALRLATSVPAMRAAIFRACAFFFFASALWALLPTVVREGLGLGPAAFGLMLGAAGLGAVIAGVVLPIVRQNLSPGKLVLAASLLAFAAMALLGIVRHWAPAALALLLFGAGWLAAGTTLGATAQMTAPAWARARALGVYQLSFFGALGIGSALWGWVGTRLGVPAALVLCSAAGAITAAAVRPWRLSSVTPNSQADGQEAARNPAASPRGPGANTHGTAAFGFRPGAGSGPLSRGARGSRRFPCRDGAGASGPVARRGARLGGFTKTLPTRIAGPSYGPWSPGPNICAKKYVSMKPILRYSLAPPPCTGETGRRKRLGT